MVQATASAVSGLNLAIAQAGGDRGEELSILREREARQETFLNRLLRREQTPKNVELATKAAQNLDRTRAAIASIVQQQQSAAKAAADRVIRDASAADRTFLEALAAARENQENAIAAADITPRATDDIRERTELRTLIQNQIRRLRASDVDEKTKQAAIRALTASVISTTAAIKGLKTARDEQREANRQAALDRVAENLALRTQIAEARDAGTAAIVRRVDAEIKQALKVQAAAKRGTQEWLEATLALEQLRQKKRDLLNQQKQDAVEDRFSGFEFLQSTQGFAANLLGNLIPGFATGGLVGNVSAVRAQITDPGLGFEAEVPTANQLSRANERGVRPVQVDTTNALLRQILAALNGRQTTPPEIVQNRRQSTAVMDTLGGV